MAYDSVSDANADPNYTPVGEGAMQVAGCGAGQTTQNDRLSGMPNSGQVKTIEVHHFAPRSHEVFHKGLLRVVTCIDFRECPELGVRTEDKVDTGAGPLDFARRAIASLKYAVGGRGLPFGIHVEQVDEE